MVKHLLNALYVDLDVKPLEDRFWSKVEKAEGCWVWNGYKLNNGYSGFRVNTNYKTTAHRVAYELTIGKIPKGKEIDHLCKNRACVNPSHMEVVDHLTNMRRGDKTNVGRYNKIKTHCIYGHEFNQENTWIGKTGGRYCKTCQKRRDKEFKLRRKMKVSAYHE